MTVFRFKKPSAMTAEETKAAGSFAAQAQKSRTRALSEWDDFTRKGYNENTLFIRFDNSPNIPNDIFVVQNAADVEKTGLSLDQARTKDILDWETLGNVNVRSDFKAGVGPDSSLVKAFRNSFVAVGGTPFLADEMKGLIPFQGIIKNKPVYDLGQYASGLPQKVEEAGAAPQITPATSEDLGVTFGPGGKQMLTPKSQQLAGVTPETQGNVSPDDPNYSYVRLSPTQVLRVEKTSPILGQYPQASYAEWIQSTYSGGGGGAIEGGIVGGASGVTSATTGLPPAGGVAIAGEPAAGTTPTIDIASLKSKLSAIGIDITALSDQQIQTFGMMLKIIEVNADKNKDIAPPSLSAQDMAKYFEDAKKELDPYYQEQFDLAKQDLTQALGFLTGELQAGEAAQREQFAGQRETLSAGMAERGLGRSGIRQEAERKLAEQQRGLVESGRRQLEKQIYGTGTELERQFGTEKAGQLGLPSVVSGAYPELGLGEQQIGYQPLGGLMGTLGKEQTVAEEQRAKALAQEELIKKYGLTTGSWPL